MSAPKHTPGPWRAEEVHYHREPRIERVRIRDSDGGYVASVEADDTAEGSACTIFEIVSKRGQANARLIAAAPDLKNEGSAAVSVIEDVLKWEPSISKSMRRQLENAASNLRAAIAKARGQS